LREKEALSRSSRARRSAWPGATVTFEVLEGYRNMKEVLDRN
jgi:hypothetical protein